MCNFYSVNKYLIFVKIYCTKVDTLTYIGVKLNYERNRFGK